MMGAVTPFVFDAPIETARLRLRLPTLADVDAVLAYQGREDVARYQSFHPRDRERVTAWVTGNATATRLEHDGDHLQPLLERKTDGAVIGDLYFTVRSVRDQTAELGWTLHPDAQGAGYATEGAAALLDLAFGRLGLHRVVAELDPRNTASIALCRRLGMRDEALFREDVRFKGGWADTQVFAILDHEWAARR
jgi:RimJ/RimL family protein N-acetyltransferase